MLKNTFFIAVISILLLWTTSSYSYCVETSRGDGSLEPGVMPSNVCNGLLNTLGQQSSDTYMFRVQKNGFYGKICNEPAQISHFMATYTESNGSWSCNQTSNPCNSLDEKGVFRVDVSGNSYRVCSYR